MKKDLFFYVFIYISLLFFKDLKMLKIRMRQGDINNQNRKKCGKLSNKTNRAKLQSNKH